MIYSLHTPPENPCVLLRHYLRVTDLNETGKEMKVILWLCLLHVAACYLHPRVNGRVYRNLLMSKKQTNRDKNLSKIIEEVTYKRPKQENSIAIKDDPLYPMIETIVTAADNRKAGAIAALRINHLTEVTTFMVIVEGNSRPQISAIALSIEDDVLVQYQMQPSKQGVADSGWILLDYGSVIVHIMTPQIRQFYKLEKRWKDAENVDVSSMIVVDRASRDESDSAEDSDQSTENSDPFWN